MGEQLLKWKNFTDADYHEFSVRLNVQLQELREQIKNPSFNREHYTLGAELEVYLIDENCSPVCLNEELLKLANCPALTPEINRYNLEINLTPVEAKGATPFAALEKEMREILTMLEGHAQSLQANVIPIGILPTLEKKHLSEEYMTNRTRYHALKKSLCGGSQKRYKININGKDNLTLEGEGVSVEGANTSFQIHLRLPYDDFANYFNAAQLTAPLVLALSANSPLVLGRRLWQESRIALFKQSVDFRERGDLRWRQPSRVSFGHGWVRKEAWELFAENVALYEPLLPILYDDNGPDSVSFPELRLHNGTVWPWNRAVYEPKEGGHLRIEFRALPAGPTIVDMLANTALTIGLTLSLMDSMDYYVSRLPFHFAEYNFYRSAQDGLEAKLIWPNVGRGGFQERPIIDIIEEFLPAARDGLKRLGAVSEDNDRLWKIIEERFEKRITGAKWQLDRFEHYNKSCTVEESCYRMLVDYRENMMRGKQVASWN